MLTRSLLLILLLASIEVQATHSIGGEIRYTHISGFAYSIEFHNYAKLAISQENPEQVVFINGIATDTLERDHYVDIENASLCFGGIRINYFITEITFPSTGTYIITFEDQNRNGGILNIPNSIAQSFCVSAMLVISPMTGHNNSVTFGNPLYNIDPYYMNAEASWFLGHSLNGYDVDGDSLTFEAVAPLGLGCQPIVGYQIPVGYFNVHPATGSWEFAPEFLGEYVIAIKATEWRNGQLIGQVTRDMMVCVMPFVGIDEITNPSFTISPTLTNGPIHITTDLTHPTAFQVFDSNGSIHMQGTLQPGDKVIDLTNASAGVYHIRVNDESVRVVKQ